MRTYERKQIKMDGRMQTVTIERDTEEGEILRQAQAIKTARIAGMVGKSKGKMVARRAAPGIRKAQSVFAGVVAQRVAQEKLGPFA